MYQTSLPLCLPPVDGLCINDELKNKLKDVLISERLLTLGHMLGKGIAMTTANDACKQELSAKTFSCNQSDKH